MILNEFVWKKNTKKLPDGYRASSLSLMPLYFKRMRLALIPEDVLHSSELIALKSTTNGDCLFNLPSLLLCATGALRKYLRLMTVTERFQNRAYYGDHPLLKAWKSSKDAVFSEVTIFTLLLTNRGIKNWEHSKDRLTASKGQARIACNVGEW